MAVIIVHGDLLKASEDIIGHQVNCKGVMGSGVDKLIKEKYPEAFCANGKTVANLFAQLKYGRGKEQYTDYSAEETVLIEQKNKAMKTTLVLHHLLILAVV